MAKEEKKAPKLRFNGYTNDWERKKLGIYVPITMGQSPNSKNYTSNPRDNILVQGNADLYNNRVLKRTFTTEVTKTADKDDILMSVRAPVGDIARNQYESIVIGRGIAAIKGNNFLYYQLEKMNNSGFWKKYIAGSTFESINGKDLKSSDIYISNYKEEKSIGNIFQTLTKTIQLHERKCEELALIKQALLQKLFPKNDEVAPEVRYKNFNDAWEQRKLGEVGKTFTGLSGKTKEDFGHGDAHFVTYMNVYSNPISDPNMVENVEIDTKQQEVKKGDVFFTTSSETPEEVGMSSVWLSDAPHIYLNSFCFGFRPTVNIFHPYYLAYLLRSNNIRNKMMILAQGISRYNISKNKVMKLNVTIPNIREQQKIGEFFKQLDFLITLHHRKLEKLKQLKKFLLQNMFI